MSQKVVLQYRGFQMENSQLKPGDHLQRENVHPPFTQDEFVFLSLAIAEAAITPKDISPTVIGTRSRLETIVISHCSGGYAILYCDVTRTLAEALR